MTEVSNIADLIEDYLNGDLQTQIDDGAYAMHVWREVNGDIERAHTKGVFLKSPQGKEKLPTLFVYVDSASRVVDFNANQDIYVERLRSADFLVEKVIFKRSRYNSQQQESIEPPKQGADEPLQELNEEEILYAQQMVENLPENLKEAAFKALCSSLRREKNS